MSNINTGGPAFPAPSGWDSQGNWCRYYADSEGMTLRDYFAVKALQGILTATLTPTTVWSQDAAAETAYNVADAMLKARNV
jgi:hypothetical protein